MRFGKSTAEAGYCRRSEKRDGGLHDPRRPRQKVIGPAAEVTPLELST